MNTSSTELREWAARCADMAVAARTESERAGLLWKAQGLLMLADSEDWLAGFKSDDAASQEDFCSIRSLAAE